MSSQLGGTVGDIESAPFIEAMSQLQRRAGINNFLQIHISYTPLIGNEQSMYPKIWLQTVEANVK